MTQPLASVQWDKELDQLILIDQTRLPRHIEYLFIRTIEESWEAIKSLQVRGAPAIGMTAAYGLYLGIRHAQNASRRELEQLITEQASYLASSRPTAINLVWALERIKTKAFNHPEISPPELIQLVLEEARLIQQEDENVCRSIGEHALTLFEDGIGVLTHCNAGSLATARYGTATAPFYLAQEKGWNIKVYADETRPVLQGSRLTAFELQQAGIDVTLICDNMAASVMQKGWIQAVIVGTDRVAANGDVANKIGTYGLAVLAKAHNIPFYVAAPLSSIDLNTEQGADIPIEEREGTEITHISEIPVAPAGIQTFNPAFDVTPSHLVTAIITEKGIVRGNYKQGLAELFQNHNIVELQINEAK
ncbi:S-methyl-5-thioribose-1-phosphate isomerase [Bacillus horti]|uniref:Methylthioribose-1-phosphate isomerase n=1 Tax=Caldalkalibacillus horti TaxID=77523 RepID=A0ABT9W035_9BACI|nr:S-methyl-5-thioribose-1-phosphate isomerase [Bacillus horti]MDQ0166586.1 methylthioribose-1-phosphate isomerase [Bacillus horti]